jgi:hypothetical protein
VGHAVRIVDPDIFAFPAAADLINSVNDSGFVLKIELILLRTVPVAHRHIPECNRAITTTSHQVIADVGNAVLG